MRDAGSLPRTSLWLTMNPRLYRFVLLVLLGAIAPWLTAASAAAEPTELKVMSFNVRFSRGVPQEPAAENDWADARYPRRERAIRVVRDYMPDVLGVQEARDLQVKDMQAA